jgi:hypothetical protein
MSMLYDVRKGEKLARNEAKWADKLTRLAAQP